MDKPSKPALRKMLRDRRRDLSPELRVVQSQVLAQRVLVQAWYQVAERMAFYYPSAEEVDTLVIAWRALQEGKQVYWPMVDPEPQQRALRFKRLELPKDFFEHVPDNVPRSFQDSPAFLNFPEGAPTLWQRNRYAVWEPQGDFSSAIVAEDLDLDLIFMPTLGFDEQGNRLGMGGGHYDATLLGLNEAHLKGKALGAASSEAASSKRPLAVGLAFEAQQLLRIPLEPWDWPMDYLVTETRVLSGVSAKNSI